MRVIALTSYILEQLVLKGFHVLCVGETGTSKTVVIHDRLKNGMPENFEPILMGFSAQTSANMTQDILDGKMDKRRQGRDNNAPNDPAWRTMTQDTGLDYTQWGPALGKQFVVMVDDFNMPKCETYDAQPPVEVLRTMVDYFGWCDRKTYNKSHFLWRFRIGIAIILPHPDLVARYDRKTYRYRNLIDITLVAAMGPPGGGRNPVTARIIIGAITHG